ncbi:hypothetical protein NA57DRAFT_75863 [Rhizodiscina lignyota]|uniref:Uncharacterized protein n=1 Tax=Rhizodiscina lignyota TaxID=1504668 RepID=A0A9P4IG20_9PEZI|nr:hypothetical protein NA57DRAFT_75863 [Rhizodiscina lignyota]
MISKSASFITLLASTVLANNPIDGSLFTDNNGIAAAQAAAPLWYMATSSCLPSAAEDGNGHQTDGVDVDVVLCAVNQKQDGGCPPAPAWTGANTGYYNIPGEPFPNIPTYFQIGYCDADQSWRIYYGVYFKHDVSHKSDWEWAIVKFTNQGNNQWSRYGVLMETDGSYGVGYWGDIPNTFDGTDDWEQDGNQNRDHPKLFFSKRHHSVHYDPNGSNKDTCVAPDFRANDYQFWAYWNLRRAQDVIDPNWTYGQATSPVHLDICDNRGQSF